MQNLLSSDVAREAYGSWLLEGRRKLFERRDDVDMAVGWLQAGDR